jgi:hypothetical protein
MRPQYFSILGCSIFPLLLFIIINTNCNSNNKTVVEARDPDENRNAFLFQVSKESIRDDYDNDFYNRVDDQLVLQQQNQQQLFVKEYNPNLALSLTDEIYEENNLHEIEDVRIKPLFLESPSASSYDTIHRVILWYHPYCAQSQRFKSTFLRLAKQTQEQHHPAAELDTSSGIAPPPTTTTTESNVEFHAISCSAHHWLCEEYDIKDFPIVWVYKKNTLDHQVLMDYTMQGLAKILDFTLVTSKNDDLKNDIENQDEDYNMRKAKKEDMDKSSPSLSIPSTSEIGSQTFDNEYDNEEEVIDILGASNDIHKRTRNDIFHDAAMSFMHSITSHSYRHGNNDSDDEEYKVLSEYFDLLFWSLPPSWKIYTLLNDVRFSLKELTSTSSSHGGPLSKGESINRMLNAVDSHKNFVLDKAWPEWTQSCRSHGFWYQCGLWNLFHIISVGVAERHKAVLGGRDRVSTEYAALTIKHYVTNFIVDGQSQKGTQKDYWNTFLDLIKRDCGYKQGRCSRFARQGGKKSHHYYSDVNHWREFSLWLWEVHNEMNVRLHKEQMKVEGQDCCTKEQEKEVLYPSHKDCPDCHLLSGKWDRAKVYDFLKTQYWPAGIHNFRYVVLDVKDEVLRKEEHMSGYFGNRVIIIIAVICLLISYGWDAWRSYMLNTSILKKHND